MSSEVKAPEPWLSGTFTDVPAVPRAVLHALEAVKSDISHWCSGLSDRELNAQPNGLAPIAFHLRHIARSTDRLLSYAEGRELTPQQIAAMKAEHEPAATRDELLSELEQALTVAAARVRALAALPVEEARSIGRKRLPTTLGGLLIHVAEHAQRHTGQAIISAKLAAALREQEASQYRKTYLDSSYRHHDPS